MSLRVALVSALLLVAIAASLAVFWTGALVGTKNADATSESNHIILSFDLQGDLGNLDDGVGGLGNKTFGWCQKYTLVVDIGSPKLNFFLRN